MTDYKSRSTSRTEQQHDHVDFGIGDPKGRSIGARISTWEETFTAAPVDVHYWSNIKPGTYKCLRTWTTRAGHTFGPVQRPKYFDTQEERNAEIERYTEYARKAAIKKTGR